MHAGQALFQPSHISSTLLGFLNSNSFSKLKNPKNAKFHSPNYKIHGTNNKMVEVLKQICLQTSQISQARIIPVCGYLKYMILTVIFLELVIGLQIKVAKISIPVQMCLFIF